MTEMLEKHYGSSMHDISDIVIENPAMMHLKDKTKIQAEPVIPRGPKTQIVTKRKDGKKRITPAFIGGITSSTPKPFGAKDTNSFFPPKPIDDKDDDGEAMEVDENGKIVKNVEKDDKEPVVEGQDLSQLFEEKDPKVPVKPTEKPIGPPKENGIEKTKNAESDKDKVETKLPESPKKAVPQSPQKSKSKEKPKEIQLDFNIDKPEGKYFLDIFKKLFKQYFQKKPKKRKMRKNVNEKRKKKLSFKHLQLNPWQLQAERRAKQIPFPR